MLFEVEEGNAQLAGQGPGNRLFRDEAAFDDNTPELAPAAFLLVQREFQLLVAEQALLDKQITETDFFRPNHRTLRTKPVSFIFFANRMILADARRNTTLRRTFPPLLLFATPRSQP